MYIKFWGVRGSVPSGNPETVKVGGNTTCVEIRCGEELIVIDTGTGFRNLGMDLMKELPVKGTILYSHVHWDHIQGFPFFTPFFYPRQRIQSIWWNQFANNGRRGAQTANDSSLFSCENRFVWC